MFNGIYFCQFSCTEMFSKILAEKIKTHCREREREMKVSVALHHTAVSALVAS